MRFKSRQQCWLCERTFYSDEGRFPVGSPMKHHVIPKQKYRDRWEDAEIVVLCKMCHKQLHKMFSNNQLKHMEKDELKQHEKIKEYMKWIRKE